MAARQPSKVTTYHGLMLKCQLEEALQAYRNKVPLLTEVDFDGPDFDEQNKENINNAKRRLHNCLLANYHANGLYLHIWGRKPNPDKNAQVIGAFIHGS